MQITTIGLDLAKNLFQVHAVDDEGQVLLRRRLARAEVVPFFATLAPCRIGVEACGTAHYWARELIALGHEVRLMPAAYVKPYVKRGKNDAADAEAICEAVTRPTMRFVPVKSAEAQSILMVHRTRDLLVRQRTMLVNALRGHLAELGIVAAQGIAKVTQLAAMIFDEADGRLPIFARQAIQALVHQIRDVQARIATLEAELVAWCRRDDASRRLATIPGVGPITATAMAATVTDPSCFSSGRQLAAWLGLVPRQNSSGGKQRLAGISKQGDRYLRRLLVVGARTVIRYARSQAPVGVPWIVALLGRRPALVAAVALANKMARIAWAILARGEVYRPAAVASN
jgi:transposase